MGIYESIREEREARVSEQFQDREPSQPKKMLAIREARWNLGEARKEQNRLVIEIYRLNFDPQNAIRLPSREDVERDAEIARRNEEMRESGASNRQLREEFGFNLTRSENLRRIVAAKEERWAGNEYSIAWREYEIAERNLASAAAALLAAEALEDDEPGAVVKYRHWERAYSRALDSCAE